MLFYQLRRMKRTPVASLAVLLFAAVLVLILCVLHAFALREKEEYQKVLQETPITLHVTNLKGTSAHGLDAPAWVLSVFRGGVKNSLKDYVKDVQAEASWGTYALEIDGQSPEMQEWMVTGVLSESQILARTGEAVNWLPGFDASLLSVTENICILPDSLAANGIPETVTLHFYRKGDSPTDTKEYYYDLTLTVAGTYSGSVIYCPFNVMWSIQGNLNSTLKLDSISAVLIDNSLQMEATEQARQWFPAPDLSGKHIPWDYSWYTHYPYALRVDDSQLLAAKDAAENSMTVNSICTVLVFGISAAAGFLIGFLMIRSRKKEIMLMRTMGTGNLAVFFGMLFEQMACVILGTAIGGAYNMWQPIQRLGLFVVVYASGLILALVVFLRTNLLAAMKEDA